jgi:hypothetical protein
VDDEIPYRRPVWLRWLPVGGLALAAVVLLAWVVVTAVSGRPAPAGGATSTVVTTTATRSTVANGVPPQAAPTTAVEPAPAKGTLPPPLTTAQKAAEQAELTAEAARLTRPLSLASPTGWDQYLPAGKPYPGASTEEDIATCPHLADRLTAALGKKMSYWTGTLPAGPYGCSWVPVPLSYDGPYTYAYQLNVGYLADGTTTAQLRTGFYENGPETCPGLDVPAVAPGAVLVRCQQPTDLEYSLVLPDSRRAGIWLLHATARAGAPHSAAEALDALVAAVRPVYG